MPKQLKYTKNSLRPNGINYNVFKERDSYGETFYSMLMIQMIYGLEEMVGFGNLKTFHWNSSKDLVKYIS